MATALPQVGNALRDWTSNEVRCWPNWGCQVHWHPSGDKIVPQQGMAPPRRDRGPYPRARTGLRAEAVREPRRDLGEAVSTQSPHPIAAPQQCCDPKGLLTFEKWFGDAKGAAGTCMARAAWGAPRGALGRDSLAKEPQR
jgi:hypothetical protein